MARLSSSSATESPPKHRGVKIGLSLCCLLFGLVALALGIAIPFVVNHAIRQGVIDSALLDPSKFSDTAAQNFYNQSSNEDFYLYNCTNLYAVLTTGASPNFEEVGPVKTRRYPNRYNVSWDTANSKVSYQWLTTFEVLPESEYLLDLPIIGPNVFYLGLQAQVLRSYVGAAYGQNTSGLWSPSARFAGNYLNEKVGITGFLGSKIIPGFIGAVFKDVSKSKLLQGIRQAGLIYYNGFLTQFCAQFCAMAGLTLPGVQLQWALANANPSQSILALPPAATYFLGFNLTQPLNTSNPAVVATNFFNSTGAWGLTAAGLTQWGILAAATSTEAFVAQAMLIGAGLQIDPAFIITDVSKIGAWVGKFSNSLPSTDYGRAFELTVASAIAGLIKANAAAQAPAATTFAQMYAIPANYTPTSWDDLGALQFGCGALVAGFLLPEQPLFATGMGMSLTALSNNVPDPDTPMNFADMATEAEPMEFTAGIAYYVKHNTNLTTEQQAARAGWPAGADQTMLWTDNPALLYFNGTTAFHQLSIPQTNAFFKVMLGSSAGYSNVLSAAAQVAGGYAQGYQGYRQANQSIPASIAYGTGVAMSQYNAQMADSTSALSNPDVQMFLTRENYYAVFTYLFHYLGNELAGPLSMLDPTTGLAPQNNGLFTQMTVSEMLFGSSTRTGSVVQYRARFPSVEIPTIGGPLLNSANYQTLLDQDYLQHLEGRQWVQDTGHADIARVSQWIEWEGTRQYEDACDLNDPARTQDCSPAGSNNEASNNWPAWGAPAVLQGSGSSTQISPFLEKTSEIPAKLAFYVSEMRRPVTVQYQGDVEIQGINMRRYGLWNAIIYANETLPSPNTEKNDEVWYQANVPDGMFSIQTVKGGVPAVVSIPHFGLVPNGTINRGVTCNGVPCTGPTSPYTPALHETFLAIEPLTGITMKGAKRLQANFRVSAKEYYTGQSLAAYPAYPAAFPPGYSQPIPPLQGLGGLNYHYNNLFANGRETIYIPYYWADIHDEIQPVDAAKARDSLAKIERAREASVGVRYGGIIGGCLIIILSVVGLVMACKR